MSVCYSNDSREMKGQLHLIGPAFFAIALLLATAASADADIINPNWVKPGWRYRQHHQPPGEGCPAPVDCNCPAVVECPKDSSVGGTPPTQEEESWKVLMFYRKFVRRVFDERKLVEHPEDALHRMRNIQFKVSEDQVKRLREARTASEIDRVVTEIVEQSEGGEYYAMAESFCWSMLSLYVKALQSTIFLYWVLPALVVLGIIVVARLWHIRMWILIPMLALVVTYTLTYQDCNNQLALGSLARLMKSSDGRNPCDNYEPSNWFQRLIYKNTEAECIEHLRSVHGMKRDFCDPSEVFIEMVAKLQLKYFESFVKQMVSTFKSILASSSYVESFFITIFMLGLVYLLVTGGIKYGLFASGRLVADLLTRGDHRPRQAEPVQGGGGVAHQAMPQIPYNINIHITQPRRTNSRIEIVPNRIEEIQASVEPKPAALPAPADKGAATLPRVEDGSGDGASKVAQPKLAKESEDSSSDESIVVIQDRFHEDIEEEQSNISPAGTAPEVK